MAHWVDCEYEEMFAQAEQDAARLERAIDAIVELAADVDRGIIDTAEFRRLAAEARAAKRPKVFA